MLSQINELANKINDIVIDDNKKNTYCVLSIDIGLLNLGLSVSNLDHEFNLIDIIWIDLIDMTHFSHKVLSKNDCKLQHTKTFCDWTNHVFQEIKYFEEADFILIERQPPIGFVAIEQLIFSRWRHKSILISPNSMHKHFNIGQFDYVKRKEYTEKIAKTKINKNLLEQIDFYNRFHDIADSICIMLYWISKKQNEYNIIKRKKIFLERNIMLETNRSNMSMNEWFECHRYIPRS